MSNDLRTLEPAFKQILLNRDVIAIDQDPLGIMGKLVREVSAFSTSRELHCSSSKSIGVYLKPVTPTRGENTSFALAVLNKNELEVKVSIDK
ncbi:hypothetical protein ANCDUO_15747 [Ancylostoma duodenale]|uniref:Uncharacterized protein n=1 Tax=Ancylostoma duodenale TaxID=51022 RepID=A0A0C2CCQ7_9BILA|nr:hypothetical protein ANCDUO_15747 [Ancylostoma duodenale]